MGLVIFVHITLLQAELTTRKGGKKFPMYDLVLTLEWEGLLAGSDAMVRTQVGCLTPNTERHSNALHACLSVVES